MCGRFSLAADASELQAAFPGFFVPEQVSPRYNVAPTQPILAIPNNIEKRADIFVWGLIPSWSKDPTIGVRMINARAEGLAEKPSFRGPYRYKRCIIPVTGFYEWKKNPEEKTKTPYNICMQGGGVFGLAGLWDEWLSSDGSIVRSCTIITTTPNPLMAQLHDRMPVILAPQDYSTWLDPKPVKPGELDGLLKPYPQQHMAAYAVSTLVNSASNDSPVCVQAVA